jgi:hypothetical protein
MLDSYGMVDDGDLDLVNVGKWSEDFLCVGNTRRTVYVFDEKGGVPQIRRRRECLRVFDWIHCIQFLVETAPMLSVTSYEAVGSSVEVVGGLVEE